MLEIEMGKAFTYNPQKKREIEKICLPFVNDVILCEPFHYQQHKIMTSNKSTKLNQHLYAWDQPTMRNAGLNLCNKSVPLIVTLGVFMPVLVKTDILHLYTLKAM